MIVLAPAANVKNGTGLKLGCPHYYHVAAAPQVLLEPTESVVGPFLLSRYCRSHIRSSPRVVGRLCAAEFRGTIFNPLG